MEGDRGQDGGGAPSSGSLLNLPQPMILVFRQLVKLSGVPSA
jgi:hypothetical protein